MEHTSFMSFVRYLKERWTSCSAFQPPIIGCADNEIEQLRVAQGVAHLPILYREFMRQMGYEDGGLGKFLNAHLTYSDALTFKSEEKGFCLPLLHSFGIEKESFVFLTDNDNYLLFFDTRDIRDDPVVYNIRPNTEVGQTYVKVELGGLSGVLVDFVERCYPNLDE